eukprot:4928141-Pleurochrysis_carterae.AAC.1
MRQIAQSRLQHGLAARPLCVRELRSALRGAEAAGLSPDEGAVEAVKRRLREVSELTERVQRLFLLASPSVSELEATLAEVQVLHLPCCTEVAAKLDE